MLVGNKIHGDASQQIKNRAMALVTSTAQRDTAVNHMMTRPDILLLILVTPGEGDQDTVVTWQNAKTRITINLYVQQNDPPLKLEGDLLHELILHAAPATDKHMAAVTTGGTPVYPIDDDEIGVQEEAEHADVDRWYQTAAIAAANSRNLLERVVADAATHSTDTATALLQRLVGGQQLTADEAAELQQGVVDVDVNDDDDV